MSRQSRDKGDRLEKHLEWLHGQYQSVMHKKAFVKHHGTTGVHIKRFNKQTHQFETIFQARESLPDFGGVLRGGRSVVFDAKATGDYKYSHPKGRMHQCKHLNIAARFGSFAFILVVVDEREGFMLLPHPKWDLDKGWSIHLDDPKPGSDPTVIKVPDYASGSYIPDWIEVIDEYNNKLDI